MVAGSLTKALMRHYILDHMSMPDCLLAESMRVSSCEEGRARQDALLAVGR